MFVNKENTMCHLLFLTMLGIYGNKIVTSFSFNRFTKQGARGRPQVSLSSSNMPYFVNPMNSSPDNPHSDKPTTVIAGATGYIGRAVVRESVQQGYRTLALVRDMSKIRSEEGKRLYGDAFEGAEVVECDVENRQNIVDTVKQARATEGGDITVISCLASPSGIRKEAYAIDYQATLNCLEAGMELNAKHFVLLSAFCVRNPLLQLQQAKLKVCSSFMYSHYIAHSKTYSAFLTLHSHYPCCFLSLKLL